MGKNGKLLNLNSDSPKYGNKSLVTKEQENELKRRKITFSFSYFKQIPNFQIGECSKGWHIGLLERLGALGTMTPQEVLEENRGSIALRCHPIDWSASNPQPIGFSGILLAKRQNSFYCTYFLHNRNVADTKSPYPIKRLEVIRWFNQKSMVFNQSLS